jgi:crossover junction endodeoxyribonuclease RuvC
MPRESFYVGIDPGSRRLGYACIKKGSTGQMNIIKSGEILFEESELFSSRLSFIYDFFGSFFRGLKSDFGTDICIKLIVEEQFVAKNVQSSFVLVSVRAILIMLSFKESVGFLGIAPCTVKKILTGNGAAPKEAVAVALSSLLDCDFTTSSRDETDAIAICLSAALEGL